MAGPSPWQYMNDQAQAIPPRTSEAEGPSLVPDFQQPQYAPEDDSSDIADLAALTLLQQGADPVLLNKLKPKGAGQSQTISTAMTTRTPGPTSDADQALLKQYGELSQQSLSDQRSGLNDLQNQINEYKKQGQGFDYTPFASFAKFLNPENDFVGAAQSMKPQSPQEKSEKLIALQDMLQKRKQDMSKEQLAALAAQIKASKDTSLDTEAKLSVINKNNSIAASMGMGGLRSQMQDKGQAFAAHKDLVAKVKTDRDLNKRTTQFQNLSNALAAVEKPDVTPVQQFAELQQAIRANMGIGGTSGVSERAHTYMDSIGMQTAQLKQFLTGDPQDIIKTHPEIYHHIKEVAKIEMDNIKKQKDARMGLLTKGFDSMYRKNPELKADLDAAAEAAGAQFEDSSPPLSPAPQVGDVRTGPSGTFKFKGGNINDRNNWEKQ